MRRIGIAVSRYITYMHSWGLLARTSVFSSCKNGGLAFVGCSIRGDVASAVLSQRRILRYALSEEL